MNFSLFNTENREIVFEMAAFQNDISNYSASLVSSPVSFTVSNGFLEVLSPSHHKCPRSIFCKKYYKDAWRAKNNSHVTTFKC